MSDEARAEAERRFPLWLPTGDYEIDRENYSELDAKWQNEDTERDRAHFVQGAEWQAERDAVRIAELEAEVEVAEAKLAAVRAVCVENIEGTPDDPYYFVRAFRD